MFFFDFSKRTFEYYEPEKSLWKSNDLNTAKNDCPKNPLMFYNNETGNKGQAEEQLSNMSFALVGNGSVHIIGGFHPLFSNLEYNIAQNTFTQKAKMLKNANNPNLCHMDRFIYSLSGDEIDNYGTRFDRYDTVKNEWNEFPPLPQPHGFGAALCVVTNSDKVNTMGVRSTVKVVVAGGLSQKLPRKYNSAMSIFDFRDMAWGQIAFDSLFERVPRFVKSPLVQDEAGKIHILGAEGTAECYVIDIEKKTANKHGKLSRGDDPEKAGFLGDAIVHEGYAYFIYKRQDLRATRGMLRLHKGNLEAGVWDVI